MKVQRLEKLCRALQIERNELSKKVQDLSNPADSQGSETETKSSQPATDSAECSPTHTNEPEAETPPTAHSQVCQSQGEACSAQDWGNGPVPGLEPLTISPAALSLRAVSAF